MENRDKVFRLMSIILSFFILCGCSAGELTRSGEQSQTPAAVGNGTPTPAVVINGKSTNIAVNAQRPVLIKGGEICEGYLLQKIAEEKAGGSRMVKLKAFNTNDETLSPDLKKWLETRDEKNLVASELRYEEKKVLILGSANTNATGIASNFQNWFVRLDSQSIEFLSLSENPNLIFWDKDGLLNYYVVTYSTQFLDQKDWDNLTLDLLRYSISPNGEPRLVSEERNVRCE